MNVLYYCLSQLKTILLKMIKVGISFLLLIIGTSRIVEQVFMTSTFKREDGWIFLDKMVLSPGTIQI
jgi:hypothetical protein